LREGADAGDDRFAVAGLRRPLLLPRCEHLLDELLVLVLERRPLARDDEDDIATGVLIREGVPEELLAAAARGVGGEGSNFSTLRHRIPVRREHPAPCQEYAPGSEPDWPE